MLPILRLHFTSLYNPSSTLPPAMHLPYSRLPTSHPPGSGLPPQHLPFLHLMKRKENSCTWHGMRGSRREGRHVGLSVGGTCTLGGHHPLLFLGLAIWTLHALFPPATTTHAYLCATVDCFVQGLPLCHRLPVPFPLPAPGCLQLQ